MQQLLYAAVSYAVIRIVISNYTEEKLSYMHLTHGRTQETRRAAMFLQKSMQSRYLHYISFSKSIADHGRFEIFSYGALMLFSK